MPHVTGYSSEFTESFQTNRILTYSDTKKQNKQITELLTLSLQRSSTELRLWKGHKAIMSRASPTSIRIISRSCNVRPCVERRTLWRDKPTVLWIQLILNLWIHWKFLYFCVSHIVWPLLNSPNPSYSENYDRVVAVAPNCGGRQFGVK